MIAGPAGSGKSTLGRALARRVGASLLDLDDITNPLLDSLGPVVAPGGHWNDPEHRAVVRPARYAALRSVAAAQIGAGRDVVLVAPFTAELAGGPAWDALVDAVAPASTIVVWLDAPAGALAQRVRDRDDPRDVGDNSVAPPDPPLVPHLRVEAALRTAEQVEAICVSMV